MRSSVRLGKDRKTSTSHEALHQGRTGTPKRWGRSPADKTAAVESCSEERGGRDRTWRGNEALLFLNPTNI